MLDAYDQTKHLIRRSAMYDVVRRLRDNAAIVRWIRSGRPLPAPGVIKRELLRTYARQHGVRVLVETGTHLGDTIADLRSNFEALHSIELDDRLYRLAQKRFARADNVKLHHGDSAVVLPKILTELRQPALFWLDGHFSGVGTAKGAADTPIAQELQHILRHAVDGHVILIDDARFFGIGDYPSIEAMTELVTSVRPGWRLYLDDDILRIHR